MRFVYFLLAIILTACAAPTTKRVQIGDVPVEIEAKKQREVALQTMVTDQLRLYRVAYGIRTKSADLCPTKNSILGVVVMNNSGFGEDYKETMKSLYGISDILQVLYVEPNSPADIAGIKKGDIPLEVNGWKLPVGAKAADTFGSKLATLLKDEKPLQVQFLRDSEKLNTTISPVKSCAYSAILQQDDLVNAFADGNNVIITKGMMRFAKDDTELALVVGHEFAHNAMQHMKAKQQNAAFGSLVDILAAAYGINTQGAFGNAGAGAYSQDFESEADYVGLYMLARTGIEIESAPNFWRRMAADYPAAISKSHTSTHPATAERFLALEATVAEIKGKIANGQPLVPDAKEKK